MNPNPDLTLELEQVLRVIREGAMPDSRQSLQDDSVLDAFTDVLDSLDDAALDVLMEATGGGISDAQMSANDLCKFIKAKLNQTYHDATYESVMVLRTDHGISDLSPFEKWDEFSFVREITCGALHSQIVEEIESNEPVFYAVQFHSQSPKKVEQLFGTCNAKRE